MAEFSQRGRFCTAYRAIMLQKKLLCKNSNWHTHNVKLIGIELNPELDHVPQATGAEE